MSEEDEANGRLHERDLYAWSKATELLLVDRRIQEIDWDAVGDELEKSAAVNDAKPLREAVEKLLTHLTIWNVGSQYPELVREAHKFLLREGEWVVVAREPMSLQSSRWTLAQVIDDAFITERDSTFTDARDAS